MPGIRLRAERRVGELLAKMDRTTPQLASPNGRLGNHIQSLDVIPEKSEYAQGLEQAGLSPQTAHRWQQLAKVSTLQRDWQPASMAATSTLKKWKGQMTPPLQSLP